MDAMAQQDKITTIDLMRAILARNRATLALGISLAAVVLGTSLVLLVADHLPVTAVQTDLAAERARMVIPVGAPFAVQYLVLVERDPDNGRVTTRQLLPVRFVPLASGGQ